MGSAFTMAVQVLKICVTAWATNAEISNFTPKVGLSSCFAAECISLISITVSFCHSSSFGPFLCFLLHICLLIEFCCCCQCSLHGICQEELKL